MRNLSLVVVVGALAAGCGGEAEEPSVVGTWREVVSHDDGELPDEYLPIRTFAADGTYREDPDGTFGNSTPITGTYQISGDRLAYPGGGERTYNSEFVRTDDGRLLLWVLRPVGVPDGVVGYWDGTVSYVDGGERIVNDLRLDIHADGTAQFRTLFQFDGLYYVEFDGEWQLDGEVLSFFDYGTTFHFVATDGLISAMPMVQIGV